MDFKALASEALSLPPKKRAKLAHKLIESLDTLCAAEFDALWLEQAGRRARQLDEGVAQLVAGEEVARKARALLQ